MTAHCPLLLRVFALLALSLLGLSPTQAQTPPPGRLPTWAILDFANHSGYGGSEMGRLASDAFQVELGKVNKYEIIPRQDVQLGLSSLGLTAISNLDTIQRLGRSLNADAVVTGEVASVAFTNNPRRAKVGLVIRVVDTRSGALINGGLAEGISSPRVVPANDDDALINEALANAAFAAVNRQILRFNLPFAAVQMVKDASVVTLNRGTRDGLYPGLNMIIVRGGFISDNTVIGGTTVGKIRVNHVTADSAEAAITDLNRGIRAEDRAVAIYQRPAFNVNGSGLHTADASSHPRFSGISGGILIGYLGTVSVASLIRQQSRDAKARKVAPADNQFGFDLLAKMDKSDGNVFFSPASLALALAMTYNGAGGKTREAMENTLHLQGMTVHEVNEANAALMQSLADPEPAPKQADMKQYFEPRPRLDIANALWADKRVAFAPDFQSRVQKSYQAEATTLNFQSPTAAPTINAWVSKHTQGKIAGILTPADLSSSSAVLTNAVYFKARWTELFSTSMTKDGLFTRQDGTTQTLPLMTQTHAFPYLETRDFQAIALPYGRGRLSFYVFLPRANSGLAQFARTVNAQSWDAWVAQFKAQNVDLTLPRFTADYDANLTAPLASLGMGVAFGAGANFGPMGLHGYWISKVKHKAVVKVNEKGTEAAAVTAVLMTRGGHSPPRNPIIMRVDRPFFCAIRDNATGLILFMGLIRDPK